MEDGGTEKAESGKQKAPAAAPSYGGQGGESVKTLKHFPPVRWVLNRYTLQGPVYKGDLMVSATATFFAEALHSRRRLEMEDGRESAEEG
jgi:hypothetical protein